MQRDHELGVGRLPFTTRTATRLGASGLSNPCRRGKEAYLADDLLQEVGDSLMMELGEAANRPSWLTFWRRRAWSGHSPSRTATSSSISTTRSTGPHLADALERPARVEVSLQGLFNEAARALDEAE